MFNSFSNFLHFLCISIDLPLLPAGSVLVSEIVGGCARKLRAFVRRQSDTIVTGTRNVVRRSSLSDSANEEDYVPKSFADNIRHRVVRKLLKSKSKPKPNEKSLPSEKRKLSLGVVKRVLRWRKSTNQNTPSSGSVRLEENQKDAVEINFESSVGLNSKCNEGGLSVIHSDENSGTNDSSSIIAVSSSTDASLPVKDENSTEIHHNA